ncbi:hypothetical protein LDENG_00162630 [Lucifuga dentata]|nr:hypothetical protein LDENG_00162630 [Lucifuga dentata]
MEVVAIVNRPVFTSASISSDGTLSVRHGSWVRGLTVFSLAMILIFRSVDLAVMVGRVVVVCNPVLLHRRQFFTFRFLSHMASLLEPLNLQL